MDLFDAAREMRRLSDLLEEALTELRSQAVRYAQAEDAYRSAWARTYTAASGTVDYRRAIADLETSEERRARTLSEGLKVAALEAVRSRRTQISALQSLLAAHRSEAEFARTGPEGGP